MAKKDTAFRSDLSAYKGGQRGSQLNQTGTDVGPKLSGNGLLENSYAQVDMSAVEAGKSGPHLRSNEFKSPARPAGLVAGAGTAVGAPVQVDTAASDVASDPTSPDVEAQLDFAVVHGPVRPYASAEHPKGTAAGKTPPAAEAVKKGVE